MFASNVTLINQGVKCCLVVLMTLLTSLPSASNMSVRAAPAYTDVSGPIISDTTWTLANSPYIVIANVEVWQGVTLTIQPGVVIKFNKEKLLQVAGALIARGVAANPITFTSNQASPAKGDWKHIKFVNSSVDATFDSGGNYSGGSILEYCIVEYGGDGVSGAVVEGAVETVCASPLIDHCTVRNNQSRGITAVGTSNTPAVIRNNTVSGNSGINGIFTSGGGGIAGNYSSVTGNIIRGNSTKWSSDGGGLIASHSVVTGNIISDNSAPGGYGGGIIASHSVVMGNTISGNSAEWGGGIYDDEGTVMNNILSGNSAAFGGGIHANRSTVKGNIISGNSASHSGGGVSANLFGGFNGGAMISNTITANSLTLID